MTEPLRQLTGIGFAHAEADARIRVGKHRARHFQIPFLELPKFLVGQHEAEPVLPRAGQQRRDGRTNEVVELINVQEERPARCRLLFLPGQRQLLKFGD